MTQKFKLAGASEFYTDSTWFNKLQLFDSPVTNIIRANIHTLTDLSQLALQWSVSGGCVIQPRIKRQCQWDSGEETSTHIARVHADNTVAATGTVHIAQGFHGRATGPRVTLWHCTRGEGEGWGWASRPSSAEVTPPRIGLRLDKGN